MGVFHKLTKSIIPQKYKSPTIRLFQKVFHKGLVKVSGGEEEALNWAHAQAKLTTFNLMQGFLLGTFPMPEISDNKIFVWLDPYPRGIIPVDNFKIRNDLKRCLKKNSTLEPHERFEVKLNTNFEQTVLNCAKPRNEKKNTWLTPEYRKVLLELHELGITHSVETYQNGKLVGGVLGVAINGYFITLSLFRFVDNASKVAFAYLLNKLKEDGYKLHFSGAADAWFTQFGAINVSKEEFRTEFIPAITAPVTFSTNIPELTI